MYRERGETASLLVWEGGEMEKMGTKKRAVRLAGVCKNKSTKKPRVLRGRDSKVHKFRLKGGQSLLLLPHAFDRTINPD